MDMTKNQPNEKKITLFVFFIIYFSGSTVLCGTSNFPAVVTRILPDILLFAFSIHFLREKKFRFPIKSVRIFAVIVFALLAMMIVNRDFSLNNIYEIVQLFLALIVSSVFDESVFERAFVKSMVVICTFSLVTYYVYLIFPSVIRAFPVVYNTSNTPFHFLGLSMVPDNYLGSRNFAIFREPGVFVCFICFAYILAKKNNVLNKFNTAVFFVSLISTVSTTGYLALFIIILSIILEKKSFEHFIVSAILGLAFFIVLKTQTNMLEPTGPLFSKFLVHSSSYNARFGSIELNLELMKQHPVFGAGWNNLKAFFLDSTLTVHNTNTILYFFSCYGLIVGFVYTIGLIRSFYVNQGFLLSALLIAVLVLALSGERICFDISLLTFVFMGLKSISLGKKSKYAFNQEFEPRERQL